MSEAIIDRSVEVVQTAEEDHPFSWGAAFAGALIATAISFLVISLGAGIGFLAASPYSSGPSLQTLTIGGAVWIVAAQTWGFACGGYFAARLRQRSLFGPGAETNFRDGTHGFVVWALGVVMTTTMIALGGFLAASATAQAGATVGAGAIAGPGAVASGALAQNRLTDPTGYFVDTLFRPGGNAGAAQGSAAGQTAQNEVPQATQPSGQNSRPANGDMSSAQIRQEVGRILATSLANGSMSDTDRAYIGRLVAQRTGLSEQEANARVAQAETQIRENAKQAADKAAKTASFASFWTFMALVMGAAAAIAGGVVGGNQRDENVFGAG